MQQSIHPNRKQTSASKPSSTDAASGDEVGVPATFKPSCGPVEKPFTVRLSKKACIALGNAGDHSLAKNFLSTFGAESTDDFSHWLDEPSYEPMDRLLARCDDQIIGHVHLTQRPIVWDGIKIPSVTLQDFVIHPDYKNTECCLQLLDSAIALANETDALVSAIRISGKVPDAFGNWSKCPSHAVTQSSARGVLSLMQPDLVQAPRKHYSNLLPKRRSNCRVRLCRRIEQALLTNIYRVATTNAYGAVWRNEAYWHWLLSRKVHDQVLVVEALDRRSTPTVVGYAMSQHDRILEMIMLPGYESFAKDLLIRTCQDVIERGLHEISLLLPQDNPLHEIMVTAGGCYIPGRESPSGELYLSILNRQKFIAELSPYWIHRLKQAKIPKPIALHFNLDGTLYTFTITKRGVQFKPTEDKQLGCSLSEKLFDRMLLGQLNVESAIASGPIQVESDEIMRILLALFGQVNIWQSPLDSRVPY